MVQVVTSIIRWCIVGGAGMGDVMLHHSLKEVVMSYITTTKLSEGHNTT